MKIHSAVTTALVATVVLAASSAAAQVAPLPAGFRVQEIRTNGTSLHVTRSICCTLMRFAASNVTQGIVPNSGHWIMDENPTATIALVTGFLSK